MLRIYVCQARGLDPKGIRKRIGDDDEQEEEKEQLYLKLWKFLFFFKISGAIFKI